MEPSRTPAPPIAISADLRELWRAEDVRVVELCPLARRNAKQEIEERGIDADAFFAELDRSRSLPLASQPITLRLLLDTAKPLRALRQQSLQ